MSERTDSQIIHEARGLCWHELEIVNEMEWCKLCQLGKQFAECPIIASNPDYTDPTSYLEAMAWAKKQKWWGEFIQPNGDISFNWELIVHHLTDPKQGSHALAEFLEGREG